MDVRRFNIGHHAIKVGMFPSRAIKARISIDAMAPRGMEDGVVFEAIAFDDAELDVHAGVDDGAASTMVLRRSNIGRNAIQASMLGIRGRPVEENVACEEDVAFRMASRSTTASRSSRKASRSRSRVAFALGRRVRGRRRRKIVLFVTATALLAALSRAHLENKLSEQIAFYAKPRLS